MAAAKKGSHTWSILTGKDKRCFVTGRTSGLQKHHIFYGRGRREISDKNGFWVWLTAEEHLAGLGGLHAHPGKGLDLVLKCLCQRKYEEKYGREEWMKILGQNYIQLDREEAEERQEEMEAMTQERGRKAYEDYAMDTYGALPENGCWLCQYEVQFRVSQEQMVCVHGKEDGFWLEELEDAFVDW